MSDVGGIGVRGLRFYDLRGMPNPKELNIAGLSVRVQVIGVTGSQTAVTFKSLAFPSGCLLCCRVCGSDFK